MNATWRGPTCRADSPRRAVRSLHVFAAVRLPVGPVQGFIDPHVMSPCRAVKGGMRALEVFFWW